MVDETAARTRPSRTAKPCAPMRLSFMRETSIAPNASPARSRPSCA